MRILLCAVAGACGYVALRTVSGRTCATFKEACLQLGLLADDSEWKDCLKEAASHLGAKALRQLFVHICYHNNPVSPLALWNLETESGCLFHQSMSEDFRLQRARNHHACRFFSVEQTDIDSCLYDIHDALLEISDGQSSLRSYPWTS